MKNNTMLLVISLICILWAFRHIYQIFLDFRNWGRRNQGSVMKTRWSGLSITTLYFTIFLGSIINWQSPTKIEFTLGSLIIAISTTLGLIAVHLIRDHYTEDIRLLPNFHLITSGPFKLTRHPIRLSLLGETFGLIIISSAKLLFPIWILMGIISWKRGQAENNFLLQHLKNEVHTYSQKVLTVRFTKLLRKNIKLSNKLEKFLQNQHNQN